MRARNTEANLANGANTQNAKINLQVTIFLKQKIDQSKKINQSGSCGFTSRLRVCVIRSDRSA